jgi:hypothetical protein
VRAATGPQNGSQGHSRGQSVVTARTGMTVCLLMAGLHMHTRASSADAAHPTPIGQSTLPHGPYGTLCQGRCSRPSVDLGQYVASSLEPSSWMASVDIALEDVEASADERRRRRLRGSSSDATGVLRVARRSIARVLDHVTPSRRDHVGGALATLTTARARHSGGDGSATRAIPHGMGVNKLYDDPRGQRGWCTLAVCMVGSRLLAQGRRAAACTGSSWRLEKLPAPRLGRCRPRLRGVVWHGMGGGTGCAAWLQVGGMVLTVVGVMVGASQGGGAVVDC